MNGVHPAYPADGKCPTCQWPLRLAEECDHFEYWHLHRQGDAIVATKFDNYVGHDGDMWTECPTCLDRFELPEGIIYE
jgi:hypothetical protein